MKKFFIFLLVLMLLGGLCTVIIVTNRPSPEMELKELKWVDDYTLGNPLICRYKIVDLNSYDAKNNEYLSYIFTFTTSPMSEDDIYHSETTDGFYKNYWFLFTYVNLKSGNYLKAYAHVTVINLFDENGSNYFSMTTEYTDVDGKVLEYGVDHNIVSGKCMYLMEV